MTELRYINASMQGLIQAQPDKNYQGDLVLSNFFRTDYSQFKQTSLISINGYLYQIMHYQDALRVLAALVGYRLYNNSQLGIWDFSELGEIEAYSIKESCTVLDSDIEDLKETIYFTTNLNLTNKVVLLVLGGRLIIESPDLFWRVDRQTLGLNITNVGYPAILEEDHNYIDLSVMTVDWQDHSLYTQLLTNRSILNYLNHPQTFLVLLSGNPLYESRIPIQLDQSLHLTYEPKYPLVNDNHRGLEYISNREENYWTVSPFLPKAKSRQINQFYQQRRSPGRAQLMLGSSGYFRYIHT